MPGSHGQYHKCGNEKKEKEESVPSVGHVPVSDESKGNGLVVLTFLLGFWFMLDLQKISPATFNIPQSKLPALILVSEVGIDSPNYNQLSVDWQATRWLPSWITCHHILCLVELPVFCKYIYE